MVQMKKLLFLMLFLATYVHGQDKIVHDAEYYIIENQNKDRWQTENKDISKRLADLEKKNY